MHDSSAFVDPSAGTRGAKRRLMRHALLLLGALSIFGCGNGGTDGSGGSTSATGPTSAAHGATTTTTTGGGSGVLGPAAKVRIVNLVPGLTFDAWGADTTKKPLDVKTGIAYGAISDYFDAPLDPFTTNPTFVLLPTGVMPDTTAFWQINASMGPDRGLIQVSDLHAAGERATLVLTRDSSMTVLSYETLDESSLPANDPTQATLHIAARIDDLPGGVVRAFAVAPPTCLITGSLATPDPWHVPAGTFELGVYDLQSANDCSVKLGGTQLDVAAGADELVVVYHEASVLKFLSAPIQ